MIDGKERIEWMWEGEIKNWVKVIAARYRKDLEEALHPNYQTFLGQIVDVTKEYIQVIYFPQDEPTSTKDYRIPVDCLEWLQWVSTDAYIRIDRSFVDWKSSISFSIDNTLKDEVEKVLQNPTDYFEDYDEGDSFFKPSPL